jgi:ubiquinone/menaquinone biosynthesis C-methylase UbiE
MKESNFQTKISRNSEDVIAFYDRYARNWDHRFQERRSTLEFHQIRWDSFLQVASLEKTDRVVEVGVGTGPYLDKISPLAQEIICIDGSQEMLGVLKEKHGNLRNIRPIHCDLEIPRSNISFAADMVYGFGILEHIINLDNFLTNCKRMLRPRGRIIFVTPNGKSPWYHGLRRPWRSGQHCSTDRYYSLNQLKDIMNVFGFSLEKAVFWGFFPAGIGNLPFLILKKIGKVVERTPLREYAGGLTASFISKEQKIS